MLRICFNRFLDNYLINLIFLFQNADNREINADVIIRVGEAARNVQQQLDASRNLIGEFIQNFQAASIQLQQQNEQHVDLNVDRIANLERELAEARVALQAANERAIAVAGDQLQEQLAEITRERDRLLLQQGGQAIQLQEQLDLVTAERDRLQLQNNQQTVELQNQPEQLQQLQQQLNVMTADRDRLQGLVDQPRHSNQMIADFRQLTIDNQMSYHSMIFSTFTAVFVNLFVYTFIFSLLSIIIFTI